MIFRDFIKDFDLKPRVIRISASSTFPVRTKCRFCMKGPDSYFAEKLPTKWYNARRILDLFKVSANYSIRMCQDFYLIEEPRHFTGLLAFVANPPYISYDPSLHTKRGTHPIENIVEFLACDCGRTSWSFSQRNRGNRPEIDHRKARYNHPHRFNDWF